MLFRGTSGFNQSLGHREKLGTSLTKVSCAFTEEKMPPADMGIWPSRKWDTERGAGERVRMHIQYLLCAGHAPFPPNPRGRSKFV